MQSRGVGGNKMPKASWSVSLDRDRTRASSLCELEVSRMYLTVLLSVSAILVATYYYFHKSLSLFKKYGIPHSPPVPILGNMGPVMTMKATVADMIQATYDLRPDAKYVGVYEFMSPVIYVRDIELIKSITMKYFDHFQDHRAFLDARSDPLLGGMLFFQTGEEWKNRRSTASPVFTSSKIKTMFKLMSDCAIRFADHLAQLPEAEREQEIKNVLYKYTNDVIASCAFGVEVDSIKHPNNELFVNGKEAVVTTGVMNFLRQLMYRNLPTVANMLGLSFLSKRVEGFFRDLVRDTVKTREEKNIYRPDMLQLLMDSRSKGLSNTTMTSLAFGFFFGGFETVSSQTSFVFRLLAEYPDVQAKLQAEIDEVLKGGELTYDTVSEMKYLDAVLNETMRLYGISPFLDRMCTKTFELPPAVPGAKPFTVKPGMNLWFPVWSIHRDPKYFENPDKFDPERFVNDGKKIMNSGAFMPFGMGPRMCIGARFAVIKMKVLVFHIMARCNVKLGKKSHVPLEVAKGTLFISLRHGSWLKVEPRKNTTNGVVANGISS